MTALVSLSAGGAITGFSFVPKAAADISSPTSMPLNLVALQQSAHSAHSARTAPGSDSILRTAIVNVADYYLRMAQSKTPAEMEAIIWQHDSLDGADHGQSCAAFASLTLELAGQVVGQQSWASGGSSYPWPLHSWADVRVEPNPASLGIISIQQDAETQHRWHPLGDGYRPLPGDWVLFDGHVEVITGDSGGVLRTVGGDSLPNFSVNAHEYRAPLSSAGVVGFVNNGSLPAGSGGRQQGSSSSGTLAGSSSPGQDGNSSGGQGESSSVGQGTTSSGDTGPAAAAAGADAGGLAAIPGTSALAAQNVQAGAAGNRQAGRREAGSRGRANVRSARRTPGDASIPGLAVPAPRSGAAAGKASTHQARTDKAAHRAQGRQTAQDTSAPQAAQAVRGDAAIPGLRAAADPTPGHHGVAYRRHHPSPARKPVSETQIQQAFISEVAPGAIAAQHRYGVPAAVTIAQAIDESGWGQSQLAARDHNLFGIKGTGPAGSVPLPTEEYVNGQPVSTSASFRVYHDAAESIEDHGRLLAHSGYYHQAMAEQQNPDRFAAALTGVYATDPNYGANLISLMRRYDLYRYGTPGAGQPDRRAGAVQPGGPAAVQPGGAAIPGVPGGAPPPAQPSGSASPPAATPEPTRTASPEPTQTATSPPTQTGSPQPTQTGRPQPTPTDVPRPTQTATPQPTQAGTPQPTRRGSPQPTQTGSPQLTQSDTRGASGTASSAPARTPTPPRAATGSRKPAGTSTAQTPSRPRAAVTRTPQGASANNRRAAGAAGVADSGFTTITPTGPPVLPSGHPRAERAA